MEKKDLLEAVAEGLKPVGEEIKGVKGSVEGIDARLKKIEALPLEKFAAPAVISSQKFLGYDLNRQSRWLKSQTVGKHEFSAFNSEEKVDAFSKFMIAYVRALHPKIQDPEARAALVEMTKADLAEGSGSTGQYLVPDEYQWDIVTLARSRAYFLQIARVMPMTSDVMLVPSEATLASINWKAEAAQLSQGEPTFGQVTLTAKKATAYAIISNELIADSRIDISSILTEQFAYGIALDIDNQALNGTGTPMSGLLVSGVLSTNVVTLSGANTSTITAADLSLGVEKLSEGDLANAKFMFSRLAIHYIRSLSDDSGTPITTPLLNAMQPQIYGFPYMVSEKIANNNTTSTPFGLFGDFQKFIIGRRNGAMALDVDPYGKFDYDQTRFRMITRWALSIGRETAFVKFVNHS